MEEGGRGQRERSRGYKREKEKEGRGTYDRRKAIVAEKQEYEERGGRWKKENEYYEEKSQKVWLKKERKSYAGASGSRRE